MYKPSNYTYIVENGNGDFLLYNTRVGEKSFLKIPKEHCDILQILQSNLVEENEVSSLLFKLGFLVMEDYDEEEEIKENFQRSVQDKQLNLIIAPTEDCNFRCSYCCEQFSKKRMTQSTMKSILRFVEKRIDSVSSLNVDWFGGEPLLALDIINELSIQLMQICKKSNKNYSAFITSNGYLLDLKTFESLYKSHVLTYQITLDGVPYIHDRQRTTINGNPTFNTILNNLIAIRDSDIGKHATILILTNLSDCIEDVKEYKKIFYTLFSKDSRFEFYCARIMDLGGKRIKQYREHLLDCNGMNRLYSKIMSVEQYPLRYNFRKFLNPGNLLCYAGKKNSFLISCDGHIYKCEHVFQTNKDQSLGCIDSQGNLIITDKTKEKIWLAKWNSCQSFDCKLKPLCFGEDCIKNRVREGNRKKDECGFELCHFEKKTLEQVLLLLDRDCNAFQNIYDIISQLR